MMSEIHKHAWANQKPQLEETTLKIDSAQTTYAGKYVCDAYSNRKLYVHLHPVSLSLFLASADHKPSIQ